MLLVGLTNLGGNAYSTQFSCATLISNSRCDINKWKTELGNHMINKLGAICGSSIKVFVHL